MKTEPDNSNARQVKKFFRNGGCPGLPRDFLEQIFNEQRDDIRQALAMVRDADPKTYLRTMIEIAKLVVPKTIDGRVDHFNHDIDELRALSQFNDQPRIADNADFIELTPWQQLDATPLHPDITDRPSDLQSSLPEH